MNIILLGYRGSGKTTLGKLLADQLWKTFYDTDAQARKKFDNASIADIWTRHGEQAWRDAEAAVIADLCKKENAVIALGGGALTHPDALKAVQAASDTVRIYLKCDPAVLLDRIQMDPASRASRPSLTSHAGSLEEIKTVLAQREPTYLAVADKTFDVTHQTNPADTVTHLIKRCL